MLELFCTRKWPAAFLAHDTSLLFELELRPSIGSLEIWLGSLENSPARPRSRSKMLEKNLLDFCSDRKKIENFMLEIARIETQCSKCSLDDRSQNLIRKYRKYLPFFGCENEKHMCFSFYWSRCT